MKTNRKNMHEVKEVEVTTYQEMVNRFVHYLNLYPSVEVALEITLEEAEGHNAKLVQSMNSAIGQLKDGGQDVAVLRQWSETSSVNKLAEIADNIEFAKANNLDIGHHCFHKHTGIDPTKKRRSNNSNRFRRKRRFKK